jgi:hypothetical protein
MAHCISCDKDKPNVDDSGECFRCRVSGIGFSFVGGGGFTREAFHAATNHEVRQATVRAAKRSGRAIEPRPVRKELI